MAAEGLPKFPAGTGERIGGGGAVLVPTAVRVAVRLAALVGANRTVTVHVFPGLSVLRQVSPVMVNAADPVSRTRSLPVAVPPVLASVNVREAVFPVGTCP